MRLVRTEQQSRSHRVAKVADLRPGDMFFMADHLAVTGKGSYVICISAERYTDEADRELVNVTYLQRSRVRHCVFDLFIGITLMF